jgi:hypothetical protein
MVMNYSEVESRVREATNDDTWGPHGSIMSEIAKYTFTYEHFPEVMSMLWKRMLQEKKNWRRVYKVCGYRGNILSFYNGLIYPNVNANTLKVSLLFIQYLLCCSRCCYCRICFGMVLNVL